MTIIFKAYCYVNNETATTSDSYWLLAQNSSSALCASYSEFLLIINSSKLGFCAKVLLAWHFNAQIMEEITSTSKLIIDTFSLASVKKLGGLSLIFPKVSDLPSIFGTFPSHESVLTLSVY